MRKRSQKEIEAKVCEVFKKSFEDFTKPEVGVQINKSGEVEIQISRMYEYVEMNLKHLRQLADFFETDNINDDRYHWSGCETCDFGSNYQIILRISPE